MRRFEFNLFADYFQFYFQDEHAEGDLSESWNREAVARMFALAPGAVGVGTVRNMDVPVEVEVHDGEPAEDFDSWDHVIECSLEVPSGKIVIAGSSDYFPDAARIAVDPGSYKARISYGALDALSDDELDGDDHYRVQLWRAPGIEPRVLKQREY